MYLYRAMGIEELKRFINNETIEGRGTTEHKWVCFLPETTSAFPKSSFWDKTEMRCIDRYEPEIQVDAKKALPSLWIKNPQLYVKFYIDDAKFRETLENKKARGEYCQYDDMGLGGPRPGTHLIDIYEYQIRDYSSQDMEISEVSFIPDPRNKSICKVDLSLSDICKIADSQVSAPFIYYDEQNHIAVFASELKEINYPYLDRFPDDTLIICNTCFGTEVAIKPCFNSEYKPDKNTELKLMQLCSKLGYELGDGMEDGIFGEEKYGFIVEKPTNELREPDFYKTMQKIYGHINSEVPKEIKEFSKFAYQAKTEMSSNLSYLAVLQVGEDIYIPVGVHGENLFKCGNKFINGSQLIERLVSEPEATTIQIGDYHTLYKENRAELEYNAKISNAKEVVESLDIKIDGKTIDLKQTDIEIRKSVEPSENNL